MSIEEHRKNIAEVPEELSAAGAASGLSLSLLQQETLFFNISEAVCEHVADYLGCEQAGVRDVAKFLGRSRRWTRKLLNNPERLSLLDISVTLDKIGCRLTLEQRISCQSNEELAS